MNAVVTGGCKGLGLSFTKELVRRGYHVYALYNSSIHAAESLASDDITTIHCDITNEEEIIKSLPDNIDLLINNAGLAADNLYQDKTKEEFMRVLEVNVCGTFLMIKHSIPKLTKDAVIVNISSDNSIDGNSIYSMDYDASKAGINLLTKDFAMALEHKIVSICPGWINTEEVQKMSPIFLNQEMARNHQTRLIDPDQLASIILDGIPEYTTGSIVEIKEI